MGSHMLNIIIKYIEMLYLSCMCRYTDSDAKQPSMSIA